MAGAAKICGASLACRPGCTECCIGPFNISALDADRLRRGLDELARRDPARAEAIRERAREACAAFAPDFRGDPATGALSGDEAAEDAFCDAHAARPCPALDPATGYCDLYAHRPIGCRSYGPPMRIEGVDLPPCRLCFVDAPPAAIEACRTTLDCGSLEDPLEETARDAGSPAETLIAFALVRP
jgi:Fe-S-cluster containining protein